MEQIITVEHIGKSYQLRHQQERYQTLRDSIISFIQKPFARKSKRETFWALQNISFGVQKGEIVGIIGPNGAGKSTLLKILSKITPPTTGQARIRGRISSLLEVGTGFHPELTGRENIYLNGAILGMSRAEIEKKFSEIVAFAGVEKFLDTAVKHFSSGMFVRLAFAVAAHLEPDILVIDEVLAVGDAEFQRKSLKKMEEVTKTKGRSIIFVSHNMGAIQQLCDRVLVLRSGQIVYEGTPREAIAYYLEHVISKEQAPIATRTDRDGNGAVRLKDVVVTNAEGDTAIGNGDSILLRITFDERLKRHRQVQLRIAFVDPLSNVLFRVDTDQIPVATIKGDTIKIVTDTINLAPVHCSVFIGVFVDEQLSDYLQNALHTEIIGRQQPGVKMYSRDLAMLLVGHRVVQ